MSGRSKNVLDSDILCSLSPLYSYRPKKASTPSLSLRRSWISEEPKRATRPLRPTSPDVAAERKLKEVWCVCGSYDRPAVSICSETDVNSSKKAQGRFPPKSERTLEPARAVKFLPKRVVPKYPPQPQSTPYINNNNICPRNFGVMYVFTYHRPP